MKQKLFENVGGNQFVLNEDMNDEYGKCEICGKPFVFDEDIVKIELIGCGQSQGHAVRWNMGNRTMHQECFLKSNPKQLLRDLDKRR